VLLQYVAYSLHKGVSSRFEERVTLLHTTSPLSDNPKLWQLIPRFCQEEVELAG